MSTKIWDEDTCRAEALKHKTRSEFAISSRSAYNVARKNGWLTEYNWFEEPLKRNYWNKQTCYNESKKYTSRTAFLKGTPRAYQVARKNGWLNDYHWLVLKRQPKEEWTQDKCKEEALKYDTKTKFQKGSPSAYNEAIKNGWINSYNWFKQNKRPSGYWKEDTCKEEALKYKTKGEFAKGCHGAYKVACTKGWLKEYHWLEQKQKPNNFWNENTCREEAMKYTSRGDFANGNSHAYNLARINGWLKDYKWFEKKWEKKWDKEACRIEAQKYNTISDFNKGCASAYNAARKNGWLESYDWFEQKRNPKGFWNETNCRAEAMKYKSRKKFYEGNGSAYDAARKNGWLDDYEWFERPDPANKTWYESTCLTEALKYKTRSEFKEFCASAYSVARKNGWIKDYYWLTNKKLFTETGRWYNVYIYKWENLHSVYVGITIDIHRRDTEHRNPKSNVFKYANENGVDIPPIKVIEEKLLPYQAPIKEEYYINYYKKLGYNVINIAKAGSVGAFGAGKWNKTSCRREAMKYKSRKAFSVGCPGAYGVALKKGWLDDYDWMVRPEPIRKWTKESCKEEAMKYKTKGEFSKKSAGAYEVARENGWLASYDWFEIKWEKKWNKDTCREEARKYKNKNEFKKKCGSAYNIAQKHGWIKEYIWFEQVRKPNGYWNKETCREEALKYKVLSDFQKGSRGAYRVAKENKWINDYDWFIIASKPNGYWNEETCREEALKYTSRAKFAKGNASAYHVARKKGWIENYDWLVTPQPTSKWNEKTCMEEALKYKSKMSFKKGCSRAYNVARENNWLKNYDWFEIKK